MTDAVPGQPKCKDGETHDWFRLDDAEPDGNERIERHMCQTCYLIDRRTFNASKQEYDARNYTGDTA